MVSLITEQEVSKRLNVCVASLRRWRLLKRGPAFVKVGSLVRYQPEDLEVWLASLPTGGRASHQQLIDQDHRRFKLTTASRILPKNLTLTRGSRVPSDLLSRAVSARGIPQGNSTLTALIAIILTACVRASLRDVGLGARAANNESSSSYGQCDVQCEETNQVWAARHGIQRELPAFFVPMDARAHFAPNEPVVENVGEQFTGVMNFLHVWCGFAFSSESGFSGWTDELPVLPACQFSLIQLRANIQYRSRPPRPVSPNLKPFLEPQQVIAGSVQPRWKAWPDAVEDSKWILIMRAGQLVFAQPKDSPLSCIPGDLLTRRVRKQHKFTEHSCFGTNVTRAFLRPSQ